MKGVHFLIILIIICLIGSFFYFSQKDTNINSIFQPSPTSILPDEASKFQVLSIPSQPAQQEKTQQEQVMPTFGVEEGAKASYSATISTSKGNIKITLDGTNAPKTVLNFISKAKSGFYKNLTFHRVEDWVIQGGDPKGNGSGGNLVQTEINSNPFTEGALGMAGIKNQSGQIISNDSQFFITKSDASWLNGQYTNFGTVTEGMDVVNKIKIGDKILGVTIE